MGLSGLPECTHPMINIHDYIRANSSHFAQLAFGADDKVLIDYHCPLTEPKASMWCHRNCLLYVVGGSKLYTTPNSRHLSKPGELLFIRKGGVVLHQRFERPYHALIFMFDDSALRQFMSEFPDLFSGGPIPEELGGVNPGVATLAFSPLVEATLLSAVPYLKEGQATSHFALEIKFKEVLINLLHARGENSFYAHVRAVCNEGPNAFIRLMQDNGSMNFTTAELARLACMSPSSFKRTFVRCFGVAPGKWLREQRIQRAKGLLARNGPSFADIAFELGYSDAAAFSRAFKRATGMTPGRFVGTSK